MAGEGGVQTGKRVLDFVQEKATARPAGRPRRLRLSFPSAGPPALAAELQWPALRRTPGPAVGLWETLEVLRCRVRDDQIEHFLKMEHGTRVVDCKKTNITTKTHLSPR